MAPQALTIGRLVTSGRGRDQGQHYVVVGILDRNHVLLSNGSSRRAGNPKKKNTKHLFAHAKLLEEVGDAVVRVTLARLGEGERQA
ncbi:MAG TPA: hypothetical protein DCM14_08135 [Clostridiales bacterium UBA8153]|nr:hypothetical protein [Clostridiales bacterium UBA8153]